MTSIAMSGDPLGHHRPRFLVEEEEEGAAGEEERYVSDSDDDDDVDRFVFLARQPAPADASEDGGEQDAMPPRGGGGGGRKRRLREMLLADDPPAAAKDKEARLGLAAPVGASSTGEQSGNDEPAVCSPERGDLFDLGKKNKKRRDRVGEPQAQRAVHGKGSGGGAPHGDVTAEQKTTVAAAAAAAGAPRRFQCNLCGRCFGSHQALGGHVHFGHRKKAKDAIAAAASPEDAAGGGNGDRGVKLATVGQEAADGNAAHGEEKAAVGKNVDFAAHHQDVDTRSFLGRNAGNTNEDMFAGAANHGGHGGDEVVEEAGGHGSLAVAVGRPHGKVHRCEVCGKECLSGQALGGHMRKHRKQSPPDGGGKEPRRSPELDWIPTQRPAVITGAQPQRERELGWI